MRKTGPFKTHLPVISGLLLWLSYPPFHYPGLAWLALVPLIVAVYLLPDTDPAFHVRKLLSRTFLSGAFWGGAIFYPLLYTVEGSWMERIVGLLALSSVTAFTLVFFTGLLCVFVHRLQLSRTTIPFISASLWTGLELLIRTAVAGFSPYFGLTMWSNPFMLQVASYAGIHGVAWLLVAGNTALALGLVAIFSPLRRRRPEAFRGAPWTFNPIWTRIVLGLFAFGIVFALVASDALFHPLSSSPIFSRVKKDERLDRGVSSSWPSPDDPWSTAISDRSSPTTMNFLLIQPNISPETYVQAAHNPGGFYEILGDLIDLTASALSDHATDDLDHLVVVWPETVLHIHGYDDPVVRRGIDELLKQWGVGFIAGLPRLAQSPMLPTETGWAKQYNSVFFWSPDGELAGLYDKINVIPVAEAQFGRGKDVGVFSWMGHRIGVGICSDAVVPGHALASVRAGATSLHYVASLGQIRRLAPMLTALIAFRAAEHQLYVTQTATTGPSLIADPKGRIVSATPWGEATSIVASVPQSPGPATFYTRFGDWIGLLSAGILLLGIGPLFRR